MPNLTFRLATPADSAFLLAIYAPYVTQSAVSFETTLPSKAEFSKRITQTLKNYPYIVAVLDKKIVGFAYTSTFKNRPAYLISAETSIYVAQNTQKLGIGRQLYSHLEEISRCQNITNLNACIAWPKTDHDPYLDFNSPNFHAHLGFKKCAHFESCAYKFERWYDMIWMQKHLTTPTKPDAFIPFSQLESYSF